MNILRSPLQWLIQSTSNFETPVDDKVVCEDDSHVIDIEEGLVMATG